MSLESRIAKPHSQRVLQNDSFCQLPQKCHFVNLLIPGIFRGNYINNKVRVKNIIFLHLYFIYTFIAKHPAINN